MVVLGSAFVIEDSKNNTAIARDVVRHINHIRKVAGIDSLGIGGDYDGLDKWPVGLEDVSGYPKLFEALIEDEEYEWTDSDLEKLAGKNLLRVFTAVEAVRDSLLNKKADNSRIDPKDLS